MDILDLKDDKTDDLETSNLGYLEVFAIDVKFLDARASGQYKLKLYKFKEQHNVLSLLILLVT